MTPLQASISQALLPELNGVTAHEKWLECATRFPWYPLPWLMMAETANKETVQKTALWFQDEQRLHWLLHYTPWEEDNWLQDQLNLIKSPVETNGEEIRPPEPADYETSESEGEKAIDRIALVINELEEKEKEDKALSNEDSRETALREQTETLDQALNPEKDEPGSQDGQAETVTVHIESDPGLYAPSEDRTTAFEPLDSEIIAEQNDRIAETLPPEETEKTEPGLETATVAEPTIEDEKNVNAPAADEPVDEEPPASDESTGPINLPAGNIENFFKPADPAQTQEPIAFEPFHSVDYFASQGIKLDVTAEPKDKFDRQLKSFTQWLKTMKKVAPTEAEMVPDPAVEAQANASVSGKEIITETMAQVLQKQGKTQKAIEIYEKLLLLHPEKSAFFAAQIEDLKNKQ